MASIDLTSKFRGQATIDQYAQSVAVIAGEGRYTSLNESQTFTFEGLTYAEAHHYDAVTATDVGGHTFSLSFQDSFTDASQGSAVFATFQNRVTRTRTSPRMWTVTVTRIGANLYLNGVLHLQGPSWMMANGGT